MENSSGSGGGLLPPPLTTTNRTLLPPSNVKQEQSGNVGTISSNNMMATNNQQNNYVKMEQKTITDAPPFFTPISTTIPSNGLPTNNSSQTLVLNGKNHNTEQMNKIDPSKMQQQTTATTNMYSNNNPQMQNQNTPNINTTITRIAGNLNGIPNASNLSMEDLKKLSQKRRLDEMTGNTTTSGYNQMNSLEMDVKRKYV